LHIAPEKGLEKRLRKQHGDYLTADLYEQDVMVKMDITDIQFADGSFDVILCNHVLEHVPDDRKAMSELHRVLRPGGWGILQVPISKLLRSTYEDSSITTDAGREQAFGQSDHVRIYGPDYRERLERAGFDVDIYDWTTEIERFGGGRNIFGLNPQESIYRVSKQG
jgi:predicted SAM-dependent methyltransferase